MIFGNEDDEKIKDTRDNNKTLLKITGQDAKIDAKFKVSDSIMIDCDVNGELEVDGNIVIDENGEVDANVKTNDAFIKGKFKGKLKAENDIEVDSSGAVSGNIKTDSIIIDRGAYFDGKVTRLNKKK